MAQKRFESTNDYDVPLLHLLYRLPGGQGETAEVCHLFDQEYGRQIPEKDRGVRTSRNEPVWYNNICWSRARLKEQGLVDMPRRGVWRITDAGRRWVEENPHETHIKGVPKQQTSGPKVHTGSPSKTGSRPGVTLGMLEQTRKGMPADQFRQVWGSLYDHLLAQERAKAITDVGPTELGRRCRKRLDEIHAFLCGKNSSSPSSEMLCDWIQFCYALELYREVAALLPYVCEEETDPVTYRRAKRVTEVSCTKLIG
jgi:hypothetical protein